MRSESRDINKTSSGRIGVLNSHLSPNPNPMASEKEAAVAAVPSDSPTMYAFLEFIFQHIYIYYWGDLI
jgi:hypothetical protein